MAGVRGRSAGRAKAAGGALCAGALTAVGLLAILVTIGFSSSRNIDALADGPAELLVWLVPATLGVALSLRAAWLAVRAFTSPGPLDRCRKACFGAVAAYATWYAVAGALT